ncbi:MAG: thioredoxin-dependent thiol peroxidase [Candidatus Marinimicrobia bacterium]|nr:thioredoxin-dependent thiol peroxidase [Candidatus Neomarinimicrobiota bacterium]TFB11078.1 thioredoxin-dependent thiol peroxidase [Candidatus Marinimicrobia bacterium MT.SAG.2]
MNLKVGDKAPGFSLRDQNGNSVSLDGYLGKKVIVFFYPKDDTPGCTVEVCNFRDDFELYEEKNAVLLGISKDGEESHKKFISKFNLPFTLLCDEDHAVVEAYGAWGEKSMYGRKYMGIVRTTVVVDAEGNVEQIYEKVKPKDHSKELLGVL